MFFSVESSADALIMCLSLFSTSHHWDITTQSGCSPSCLGFKGIGHRFLRVETVSNSRLKFSTVMKHMHPSVKLFDPSHLAIWCKYADTFNREIIYISYCISPILLDRSFWICGVVEIMPSNCRVPSYIDHEAEEESPSISEGISKSERSITPLLINEKGYLLKSISVYWNFTHPKEIFYKNHAMRNIAYHWCCDQIGAGPKTTS